MVVLLGLGLLLGLAGPPGALAQGTGWACAGPEPATAPEGEASPETAAATAGPIAFPAEGGELTVFAAASLTDAFTAIEVDLEAANPGLKITYNFAGSQTLVTQMTEGATADVFASANLAQMMAAVEAGLIAGEPEMFVSNRLAIVVPSDNPAGLTSAAGLATDGLRLVLAQAEVPVGVYARQAICLMGHDSAGYGEDFVARVAANVVSEEDDVREVLTKVQLGEADAGIVYVSDAAVAGDAVRLIEIPDLVNVLATYPIAPVVGGDPGLSAAFIGYLLGRDGQDTLAAYGFGPVP